MSDKLAFMHIVEQLKVLSISHVLARVPILSSARKRNEQAGSEKVYKAPRGSFPSERLRFGLIAYQYRGPYVSVCCSCEQPSVLMFRSRMGMLAMLSEYDHLDIGRCVMLALVHDVSMLFAML